MGSHGDALKHASGRARCQGRRPDRRHFGIACVLLALAACAPGTRPPLLVQDGRFEYPAAARAAGTQGHVVVAFAVTADGRVEGARIVESQPPGVFDAAALRYVGERRYRPMQRDGRAVAAGEQRLRVHFALGGTAWPDPRREPRP
jgi:TonB family protein